MEVSSPTPQTPQSDWQWNLWAGVLPILAMSPMLLYEAAALWSREYLRFFPLAIVWVAVLVGLQLRTSRGTTRPARRWSAIAMLAVGCSLYAYSVWIFSPRLAHLAAVLVFCAWALGRFGEKHWIEPVVWTAGLATASLLPWGWDQGILRGLLYISTWGTTATLDALAIPYVQNGSLIETRGLKLFTAEVCGGIGNFFSFATFSILLSATLRTSMLVTLKSLGLVVVWSVLADYLKMLTILLLQEFSGRDLTTGKDYQILGIMVILFVLLMIWQSLRFFTRVFAPIPVGDAEVGPAYAALNRMFCWPNAFPFENLEPKDDYEKARFRAAKEKREAELRGAPALNWRQSSLAVWSVRLSAIVCLVAMVFPIQSLGKQGLGGLSFGRSALEPEQIAKFGNVDVFPMTLSGGWQRIGQERTLRSHRSESGEHSFAWRYQAGERQLTASNDLPLQGWHDPIAQRERLGWKVLRSRTLTVDNWPWCEGVLENEFGGRTYVFYTLLELSGEPYVRLPEYLAPPTTLEDVPVEIAAANAQAENAATYQFEVVSEAAEALSPIELDELRSTFLNLRALTRQFPQ
ncbi:Transmembrane exosortase (Exosortase_EpsH) [Aureliella helgolandensis]|uniref:Transmembrane exosortase (Exosortase_EpsH) n=2 Tax=Aureliella helgolandensis TaxID=2527968 RepID=A0A518GC39_9BACT|nr:Transmembrane exosortase (Exosortase_EpsH) [Aureliella helgolandensis]